MNTTLIAYPLDSFNVEQPFVLDCDPVEVSLTLTVQDIQDVTKRRGSFSKTIELPSTANNDKAFGYAYNVQSFVGGFTPNKRIRCALWDNGIQAFNGTLQLLSIKKTAGLVSYEVGIYSEEVAFFRQIAETKLADTAGVSGFNHTLTAALASGTWQATQGSGYVYGFIDGYGYTDVQPNFFSAIFNTLIVPYFNLTPSFYAKQVVDLIFTEAGYRYESNFFDSPRFATLVLPYAGGATIQNDLSSQNSIIAAASGLPANASGFTIAESGTPSTLYEGIIPFDTDIDDPATYWDLTDHYMTNSNWYTRWAVSYRIVVTNVTLLNQQFYVAICDRNTGRPINDPLYNLAEATGANAANYISGRLLPGELGTFNFQGEIRLEPNQEIDLRLFYVQDNLVEDPFPFDVNEDTTITMVCLENPAADLNVDMVRALPPDITQADLLSDLQKMFNLYFYVSPNDPKLIYIEPFNDFYVSGAVDWSQKVDMTAQQSLQMGDPESRKRILFKYKDTGDALGKLYNDTFSDGYGSRDWQTDNFFAKGEQVVETKCSTVIPASFENGLIIGRTFDIDSNNKPKPRANGYRIAQYNYTEIPSLAPWVYLTAPNVDSLTAFTSVPFISHIDNPYAPTFDLAFGMPKQLYYKAIDDLYFSDYTNANLFNTYWRTYIIETTSKESMQIEVQVVLSALDIYNLDFRKPIYFNGILFRLLELRDYQIGGEMKCTAVMRRILNLSQPNTGSVATRTYFDSSTLVLDEMHPQVIRPNNIGQ